jgi:hypothetical protein
MTLRLMVRSPRAEVVDLVLASEAREYEVLDLLHNEAPTDYYPEVVKACLKRFPAGCWLQQGAVFPKGSDEITDDEIFIFDVRILH